MKNDGSFYGLFNDLQKKETSLQLKRIVRLKKQYEFRTVVPGVTSFQGNSVSGYLHTKLKFIVLKEKEIFVSNTRNNNYSRE